MLLTPTQFLNYTDSRRVYQYLSDSDQGTPIDPTAYLTNPIILALLEAASQELIGAVFVGRRYTIEQIVNVAGDQVYSTLPPGVQQSPSNLVPTAQTVVTPGIGEGLRALVAALTWGRLVDRRKLSSQEFQELAPSWAQAQRDVENLRLGQRIWQVPLADTAGLPGVVALGSRVWGTTITKPGLWGTSARHPIYGPQPPLPPFPFPCPPENV